jgi:hypothetical protein
MALLLYGMSECEICGKVIFEGEPVVLFPAFFVGEHPELELFNDSAFHRECVFAHSLGKEAILKLHPDISQE